MLEVLKLRLLMAKTSVKKYEAIRRSVCADGRVHGLLQFYGATAPGAGPAGSSRYKIYLKITSLIWPSPAIW